MHAKEEQERLLKWFIPPNESHKWDFTLEKYIVENSHEEVVPDSVGTIQQINVCFDKDNIVTQKKRKRRDDYHY